MRRPNKARPGDGPMEPQSLTSAALAAMVVGYPEKRIEALRSAGVLRDGPL